LRLVGISKRLQLRLVGILECHPLGAIALGHHIQLRMHCVQAGADPINRVNPRHVKNSLLSSVVSSSERPSPFASFRSKANSLSVLVDGSDIETKIRSSVFGSI